MQTISCSKKVFVFFFLLSFFLETSGIFSGDIKLVIDHIYVWSEMKKDNSTHHFLVGRLNTFESILLGLFFFFLLLNFVLSTSFYFSGQLSSLLVMFLLQFALYYLTIFFYEIETSEDLLKKKTTLLKWTYISPIFFSASFSLSFISSSIHCCPIRIQF